MSTSYRIFRGSETKQLTAFRKPASPDAWYFEPSDYDGDMLWSMGHATEHEAQEAAELDQAQLLDEVQS